MRNTLTTLLMTLGTLSAEAAPKTSYNLTGEALGLMGYDPVSYHPEGGGKPQRGSIKISAEHDGVTYRFVSQANLQTFQKNPQKYLPEYGGWCAWAVAELGKRVDIDPLSYELRGGRLYVFYKEPGLDTRELWKADPDGFIKKAAAKWQALSR